MAKTKSKPETQVITLDQVEINKLPEIQGWREKLIKIDKENPIIKEIKSHKTYEKAKKHRHNRRQGRYDVQNSESNITSRLNEIKKESKSLHAELIDIVKKGEDEQDQFIKNYEAKKEEERLEKERKEKERKDNIKNEINSFYDTWKKVLAEMEFSKIEETKNEIVTQLEEKDEKDFEEFQEDFNEKVTLLREQFKERSTYLKQHEKDRIAREKLAEEKAELERKEKERKEKEELQHQKTFEIRCNRLAEVGFESNDEMEFVNKELNLKLESFHDDVYAMDIEEFEDFIQEAKTSLVNAKAEADKINPILPNTIFNKKREEEAKTHDKPAQIKIDAEWDDSEKAKEQEVVEPETLEPEEEVEVWDLPEETPKQIADKIEALAWEIRNDWSDPRGKCRRIVDLCEKLRQLL